MRQGLSVVKFPAYVCRLLLALFVVTPISLVADSVPVRFTEGLSRGFLILADENGHKIADGEWQQTAHGNHVTAQLSFSFKDGSAFSYLTTTPQPRIVKLVYRHDGTTTFSTGDIRHKALHYVMSVDIGGVAGVVAPLIGKRPPDSDFWIIDGEIPTFAREKGPLYGGGPIWEISLVSPVPSSF